MKKYLLIISLILMASLPGFSEGLEYTPADNPDEIIYKVPEVIPEDALIEKNNDYVLYPKNTIYIDPENMPTFKQMRVRLFNSINKRRMAYDEAKKNKKQIKFPNFKLKKDKNNNNNDENLINISDENNFEAFQTEDNSDIERNSALIDSINDEMASSSDIEVAERTLSLSGTVKSEVVEKELMLDAEVLTYDNETGDITAVGNPIMVIPPQDTTVIADKLVYNETSNIIKGIGNVTIIKEGIPVKGNYAEINLNEETMLMDEVSLDKSSLVVEAEKAVQEDGLLILTNGKYHSDSSEPFRISTRMHGPHFHTMLLDPENQYLFFGDPKHQDINIHVGNVVVDARKNHDTFKFKNIKVYHKDKYLFRFPNTTIYTNKKHDYFEGNYPELGSKRRLGMFIGPGFAFEGPFGSVMKVVPFLNYNKKFGFGGLLRYVNTYNRTELGYGSSSDIFFLKGVQVLDDNLYIQYAANDYTNEWFLGGRMAKYMVEANYDKSFVNRNFLAPGMNLYFRHRIGLGYMKDYDKNSKGENLKGDRKSTVRARYMAQIYQEFYNYINEEERKSFNAGVLLQGSAAVYGTGDTQFIARFGPRINMQYKNWIQDFKYYLTGYDDHTPMPRYDKYRYGAQSIYLTEGLRVNRFLSVGWQLYANLSHDAPNKKVLQENAFFVALGPDDFKVVLGYDFMRERTYFALCLAFDPKSTTVTYDKMIIKNPERYGRSETVSEPLREIAYVPPEGDDVPEVKTNYFSRLNQKAPKKKVLEYAKVINIDDPGREYIE